MDEELRQILKENRALLESIFRSTEKTRKYFLWTLILSLVFFVLPIFIFLFALPLVLDTLTSGLAY
jgi:type IV secretory pathway component VirB8